MTGYELRVAGYELRVRGSELYRSLGTHNPELVTRNLYTTTY
jgi:hypothetical protein